MRWQHEDRAPFLTSENLLLRHQDVGTICDGEGGSKASDDVLARHC